MTGGGEWCSAVRLGRAEAKAPVSWGALLLVVVWGVFTILASGMTEVEQDILDTLVELEAGVEAMKAASSKPNLVPLFVRLTDFASKLPRDTHGQLIHYLGNGSYEKARLWLLGRDAENARGLCGR